MLFPQTNQKDKGKEVKLCKTVLLRRDYPIIQISETIDVKNIVDSEKTVLRLESIGFSFSNL